LPARAGAGRGQGLQLQKLVGESYGVLLRLEVLALVGWVPAFFAAVLLLFNFNSLGILWLSRVGKKGWYHLPALGGVQSANLAKEAIKRRQSVEYSSNVGGTKCRVESYSIQ
jgi:hypothetical protein